MIELSEDDRFVLASLDNLTAFDEYKDILQRMRDAEFSRFMSKPAVDNDNFKKDLRFRLGRISILDELIKGIGE